MIILLLLIVFLFSLYVGAKKLFDMYRKNDSESILKKKMEKI